MFETNSCPRIFGLPPGCDFATELVNGLRARIGPETPEAMARVTLILNTRRMERRVRSVFDRYGAGFLPRIRLITQIADPLDLAGLPQPVPTLQRRLELAELVRALLRADPTLSRHGAVYELADSLIALIDEMHTEGVAPSALQDLDVSDQSGHWERALKFLGIVTTYHEASGGAPDAAAINRLALRRKIASWKEKPPADPVILAGSTGSRGTGFDLMRAVAGLPQGAVILPGFDFDMPRPVWDRLCADVKQRDAMQGEDHPQFRFARLLVSLEQAFSSVRNWSEATPPTPAQNRLVSLALRPAPVTDQWLQDGPEIGPLAEATKSLTLLEAPSPRTEAEAIALRLRAAAETNTVAALVTPDRMLSRRVTAILDRWGILPDDSAGTPPHLTAPGRFLRHVAELDTGPVSAQDLVTILKHPLCHSGAERGQHLLWASELELHVRKKGIPYPDADTLAGWAKNEPAGAWLSWVCEAILARPAPEPLPLDERIARHIARASAICAGSAPDGDDSELWAKSAGQTCRAVVDDLTASAGASSPLTARDYADLFFSVLKDKEVRDRDAPHPNILIWGTIEARVMGADLLILGGLNEGTWPEMPKADPWLNRRMRKMAGLLLPERRIGLSAHDFQQAICGAEVWLTRATRSEDAATVPSRWVNRLTNLMEGLPAQGGPEALEAMKGRGREWLRRASALDTPVKAPPAERPSPVPPVASRPDHLSVTAIEKLIRDPYFIYARDILRLKPLPPVQHMPDALKRGIAIHEIFETFVSDSAKNPDLLTRERLLETARTVLEQQVPWPTERLQWLARVTKVADWFIEREHARRREAQPAVFEQSGATTVADPPFKIVARADRIDIDSLGLARIYDYKTGPAPKEDQQLHFNLQLLLTAAILCEGGFEAVSPRAVTEAVFIELSSKPIEVAAPLDKAPPDVTLAKLERLVTRYRDPDQGFTARNAVFRDADETDYDQLSRYGEWDNAQEPRKVRLT